MRVGLVVVALVVLLAGCTTPASPDPAPATSENLGTVIDNTPPPAPAAPPASQPAPSPAATPPPTPSSPSTTAPPPSAVSYYKWASMAAVNAFQNANLEALNATPMTHKDLGFAPNTMKEGTRFFLPSVCSDCSGRAMSFETAEDQAKVSDYYTRICKESAVLCTWFYEKDNLLVQVNGDMPEDRAQMYNATLQRLGS